MLQHLEVAGRAWLGAVLLAAFREHRAVLAVGPGPVPLGGCTGSGLNFLALQHLRMEAGRFKVLNHVSDGVLKGCMLLIPPCPCADCNACFHLCALGFHRSKTRPSESGG